MFQLNNNEQNINFRKYQMEPIDQIYLTFSPNQDDQNTINLKTEEMSVPNIQSFFTDHTNIFEQKVGYFQGQITNQDCYDYYLISKAELTKILNQLEGLQNIKQNIDQLNQQIKQSNQQHLQQSQIMNEGQPHKDVISVRALVGHKDSSISQRNKENNQALINVGKNNITSRNTSQQKQQYSSNSQNFSSVRKLNQPLPSRQRSQTHFNTKIIN